MPQLLKILIVLVLSLQPLRAAAQSAAYKSYIDRYSSMAVEQMHRYGVPASITLAQGLLESAAGTSTLARKANNHFGIKCGGRWNGPYILRDDDAPNEKFRVYKSVQESYEDHSRFLRNGQRYAFLFSYKITDYKNWAHGLKKAGYATNPRYAQMIIDCIERNELWRYDSNKRPSHHERHEEERKQKIEQRSDYAYPIHRCNGQFYVIARKGDTYASIAKALKSRERKLRKYNDVDDSYKLKEGDIVYLGKKAKKADKGLRTKYHTMEAGESLYTISQRFGVRLSSLCKMNPVTSTFHFSVGDNVRIR